MSQPTTEQALQLKVQDLQSQLAQAERELHAQRANAAATAPRLELPPSPASLLSAGQDAATPDARRRAMAPRYGATADMTQMVMPDVDRQNFMARSRSQQPLKKSRTSLELPSGNAMSRSVSNKSTHSNPFAGIRSVTPPYLHAVGHHPAIGTGMMDDFLRNENQPVSAFVFAASCGDPAAAPPRRNPELGDHLSLHTGLNPEDWLANMGEDCSLPSSSPFTTSPPMLSPSSVASRHYLMPQNAMFPATGVPSTCGSMTSGQTLETPMTRSSSSAVDNMSIAGQMDKVNLQPSTPLIRQDSLGQVTSQRHHRSSLGKRHSREEEELVGLGANLQQDSRAYASSAAGAADRPQPFLMARTVSDSSVKSEVSRDGASMAYHTGPIYHQHDMARSDSNDSSMSGLTGPGSQTKAVAGYPQVGMERTQSTQSTDSTSSNLRFRAKEALKKHNQNAAKAPLLQPKPAVDVTKQDPAPLAAGSDGKTAIAQQNKKYERPKRPKVLCNQCDELPEGFRGEHELRRHTEAKHKSMVKKFVCVDPGNESALKVLQPLEKCKACSTSKQYGAYYNAAAHLRRTHFRPKAIRAKNSGSGRNGKTNANASAEGGKAVPEDDKAKSKGGNTSSDWPPMNDLKVWMKAVFVPVDQPGALDVDAVGSVGRPEIDSEMMTVDSQYISPVDAMGQPLMSLPPDNILNGLGDNFANYSFEVIDDMSLQNFGDAVSHGAAPDFGIDLSNPHALIGSMPAIPVKFNFNTPLETQSSSQSLPLSQSVFGHESNYTSPVSSASTVTPGNVFRNPSAAHQHQQQQMHQNALHHPSDVGEMDFGLAFP